MYINNAREPRTLDVAAMAPVVQQGIAVLGNDWFGRRLKKDQIARAAAQGADHKRRRVRYVPAHQLVAWYTEFNSWVKTHLKNPQGPPSESALRLTFFCSNLVKAENCPGFESIVPRLRDPKEFLSAAFEVEVAVAYLNRTWTVEFVETTTERSPDLKVTTSDGEVFWVECKRREDQTQRDNEVTSFCEELKDALHRKWGPARTNIGVTLRASSDPLRHELTGLKDAILHSAEILRSHPERARASAEGTSRNGKYSFELQFLAEPDEAFPALNIPDPGTDQFEVGVTFTTVDGKPSYSNPRYFAFSNLSPPDKYIGALNAFKSAVGQLPESGPGVIWMRLAHPASSATAQDALKNMARKLKGQLSAGQNTRVNAVILSSHVYQQVSSEGNDGLAFRHASETIKHDAPRTRIPKST